MTIVAKDGNGVLINVKSTNDAGEEVIHHIVDSITAQALPTGASTEAKQDTIITELQNIDSGKLEEATFTSRTGEVQATPTANTVLGRLKDINDSLSGTLDNSVSSFYVNGVTLPSTLTNLFGQQTVSSNTVAVQFQATSAVLRVGVVVKALAANTEPIYVADSSVLTGTGFQLSAGEQVFIVIDNINKLYIVGTSATQVGVSYIGS